LHKIGDGADNIMALAGDDIINAAGGNDTIDGGAGADAMTGGTGNDTYYVDNVGDTEIEIAGGGLDTVMASVSTTLGNEVEILTLTVAGLTGTGNELDNTINGTSGIDTLDGGIGADTMNGGLGNDTYKVDNLGDVTNDTSGIDTVVTTVDSYVLNGAIENLTLAGAAHIANGNALNNVITGTSGDDTINGGIGADSMNGGLGNDTYYVDNASDTTNDTGGIDTVYAGVNYTLGATIETLRMTTAGLIGTGNALDNTLVGTSGDDTLDGGIGADTMRGGLGNDTYKVDNLGDSIVDLGGTDTVVTTIDGTTLAADIENLTLTGLARYGIGNAGANTLTGTTGNDTLDGAGGADTMIGLAGNDTYLVDDLGDVTTEIAGGGTDTVVTGIDGYVLQAEVENLTLTGAAHNGTGNAGNNFLRGQAGSDTLTALDGNDSLDGGIGADTMIGGDGDDTYYVDDINDIVIEGNGVNSGNDTVVTNFNYTLADNIENARITGTGHSVTGNSGSNHLAGESGDDTIDGGDGDDTMLGGDGDDDLICNSGNDDVNGGSGDDTYHINGGSVHIEDFLGHDTIDTSDCDDDNYIDLSGEDDSEIEGQNCNLGQGGTTVAPLDVQFLQDLSGSFGDDIANVRLLVPQIAAALQAVQVNSMFGSSTFVDKAVSPFGTTGEWVYNTLLPLTTDATVLTNTYNSMVIRNGMDAPEAQIEALMQLALHTADVGFRPDSARFVVLFTDASFHKAGDGVAGGITTPNNGDAIMDGVVPGTGEDYPFISQVKTALEAANIIPIFAVTADVVSFYNGLAGDLGRGAVVTLTANSSNVVSAITAGLTAATVTVIEDAHGGHGHDTIKGNHSDNALYGNDGDDSMHGGRGDDGLHGGSGKDTCSYDGVSDDYTYQSLAGVVTITDNDLLDGDDGRDTLDGIEVITFANGTADLSLLVYTGTTNGDSFRAMSNGNWTLHGLDGNDTLKGRNGMDIFYGDAGNDIMYGKNGNDTFTGGAGNDKMYGEVGDDTFLFSNASVVEGYDRVYGDVGNDTIRAGSNGTYIGLQEFTGIETITADGFTGVKIRASSSDQSFDFSGTTLTGIAGIEMGTGNDTVIGSVGADVIKGQAGLDRLNGGAGVDFLYGGTEADTFVFDSNALTARDSIKDFSLVQGDVLELHSLLTGYDALTSLITDFVKITESLGNSYVSVDTDGTVGGQVWTQIARVDAVLGLTDEAALLTSGNLTVTV
jgi:Ca2+-binding RTX toxin-like protein